MSLFQDKLRTTNYDRFPLYTRNKQFLGIRLPLILNHLTNSRVVDVVTKEFESGAVGEQFVPVQGRSFDPGLFTENELATLNTVASRFQQFTAGEMVNLSHEEKAWKVPFDEGKQLISYNYGFELKVM